MKHLKSYDEDEFLEVLNYYRHCVSKAPLIESSIINLLIENSTRIEGSTLTNKEIENMLEHGMTPNKPEKHKNMVRDYSDALLFVVKHYQNKIPLSKSILELLNHYVMKRNGEVKKLKSGRLIDTSTGKIRDYQVSWGKYQFMHHSKIEKNLESALSSINHRARLKQNTIGSFELAFKTHYDIISIHPFGDGNSRTSRLLMNYIQGWFREPLTTVLFQNMYEYKEALKMSWELQTVDPFINYMFNHNLFARRHQIQTEPHHKDPHFSL